MPLVIISGPANILTGDPRGASPETDPAVLQSMHGLHSDETCDDYLEEEILESLEITGGRLRLAYCSESNSVRVRTVYEVARRPSDEELKALVEETTTQWSDGIGGGDFSDHRQQVLSTTFAMALQNSGHTDIGDHFVDVYPMADDDQTQVEVRDSGSYDDELIADLAAAVDDDDSVAMVMLARRYQGGEGVEEDLTRAFELLAKAGDLGHPVGMAFAGICLKDGSGCDVDLPRAKEYISQSANAGFPLGMHCLGEMLQAEGNHSEAFAWYQRGAEVDDPGCTAELGDCFEFGNGCEVNFDKALECYEKCIELGFTAVQPAIDRINEARK